MWLSLVASLGIGPTKIWDPRNLRNDWSHSHIGVNAQYTRSYNLKLLSWVSFYRAHGEGAPLQNQTGV